MRPIWVLTSDASFPRIPERSRGRNILVGLQIMAVSEQRMIVLALCLVVLEITQKSLAGGKV